MLDFRGNWDDYLSLVEFAYNNSYHSSIEMTPYEALYERPCNISYLLGKSRKESTIRARDYRIGI